MGSGHGLCPWPGTLCSGYLWDGRWTGTKSSPGPWFGMGVLVVQLWHRGPADILAITEMLEVSSE